MCMSTQEHDSIRALEEESAETRVIAEKLHHYVEEQKRTSGANSVAKLFDLLPKNDDPQRG